MRHRFFDLAFTPGVRSEQARMGSRDAYADAAAGAATPAEALTDREGSFIADRDSFYLASVSETGWPYVQHRGGPIGFIKPIDDRNARLGRVRGQSPVCLRRQCSHERPRGDDLHGLSESAPSEGARPPPSHRKPANVRTSQPPSRDAWLPSARGALRPSDGRCPSTGIARSTSPHVSARPRSRRPSRRCMRRSQNSKRKSRNGPPLSIDCHRL